MKKRVEFIAALFLVFMKVDFMYAYSLISMVQYERTVVFNALLIIEDWSEKHMNNKDFVLMELHHQLILLVDEYSPDMHRSLKEFNNLLKARYETIMLKVEGDYELDETEANELYHLLHAAYERNPEHQEVCFQASLEYCSPVLKDKLLERELKKNYRQHTK
jgi:hypothetical protein